MTQSGNINRRRFDRFTFETTFVLESENFSGISSTSSLNLSQKGAHLISQTPLTKGSIISIEVPSEKIQLMGEVCWIGPQRDQQYDVGIAFHEFFPATKVKIANLIERIQTEPETAEGKAFSFELENNVSAFLNKYIEDLRPDPIVSAPVSYRRLGTPTEKTLSFYTPSKPQTLEGTTTSFRIDEEKVKAEMPVRSIVLALLALSLFFFKDTFTAHVTQALISTKASFTTAPAAPVAVKTAALAVPHDNQVTFVDGLIQKIQWKGASDRIEVRFDFSQDVSADQFQISKINFDDLPRQLIKISNVSGSLEQRKIMVAHSLLNQIRTGIHDDNGQKNLHIVMDLTNTNVAVVDTQQDPQSLTLLLQYTPVKE
ncbi:MAG: PilZ domain-containing protein [Proteobacteria bacterium]|jgi:hypothetical protein|nr:PilZ domain-containing protein [Pseudomonadota bacterium]